MNHPSKEDYKKTIIGNCTIEEFTAHTKHLNECEACRERHYEYLRELYDQSERMRKEVRNFKDVLFSALSSAVSTHFVTSADDAKTAVDKILKGFREVGKDGKVVVSFATAGFDILGSEEYYDHLNKCRECRGMHYDMVKEAESRLEKEPEDLALQRMVALLKEISSKITSTDESEEKSEPAEAQA